MYSLSNIKVTYPSFSLTIDKINFEKGKLYSIVGPNGSGKSSLLNILSFLEKPNCGSLFFKNEKITDFSFNNLLNKRKSISYLLQKPFLFSQNVFNNIAYGLKIRGYSKYDINKKVNKALKELSIEFLINRKVSRLSGGEAQRVALARSLVIDAEVYLFDEPTTNIDKENVENIEQMILNLKSEKGVTIIQSTHSLNQAYRMSDKVVSIINGQIQTLPYENIFSGVLIKKEDVSILPLKNDIQLFVGKYKKGKITIALDPNDILLSNNPINSSALNKFTGVITKVEKQNGSINVFVDVGVTLCALITQKSYLKMNLNIGSNVYVTFKANSVKVI